MSEKIRISSLTVSPLCLDISWQSEGRAFRSCLYRHSDFSWHFDPQTASLHPELLGELQKALFRYVRQSGQPERKRRRGDTWFAERDLR